MSLYQFTMHYGYGPARLVRAKDVYAACRYLGEAWDAVIDVRRLGKKGAF